MQMGWNGFLRTVGITTVVTSLAWIGVGFWWMPKPSRHSELPAVSASEAPQPVSYRPAVQPVVAMQSPIGATDSLIVPVSGVAPQQLTDTFNQARAGGGRRHDAIDIMAPLGTPVIAAAPGRVEKLFLSRDGGNTVYQRSGDGRVIYYYAHLASYAPGLTEGRMLNRGDSIGTVGFSGNADPAAPHLHFAVMNTTPGAKWWEPANPINPYPLLRR